MKKLLMAIILGFAFNITNAQATDCPDYISELQVVHLHGNDPVHPNHHSSHNNIVPIAIFAGLAIVAGIIVYEASDESNWTASENGIGYRF